MTIYSGHELFELKPCKILLGARGKARWRNADALFQVDNYTDAKDQNHWIVKYHGKKLILRYDQVKIS